MDLIVCPDCRKKISIDAQTCPHCGCDMTVMSNENKIKMTKELESVLLDNLKGNFIKKMILPYLLFVPALYFIIGYFYMQDSLWLSTSHQEFLYNNGLSVGIAIGIVAFIIVIKTAIKVGEKGKNAADEIVRKYKNMQ